MTSRPPPLEVGPGVALEQERRETKRVNTGPSKPPVPTLGRAAIREARETPPLVVESGVAEAKPCSWVPLFTLKGHKSAVKAVSWSPDGTRLLTSSKDRSVRLWEPLSGRSIRSFRGHQSVVYTVQWSPDGCMFASASKDKTVRVWNPDETERGNAACLAVCRGHGDMVWSVEWSPDGMEIASSSRDGTARVWDPRSGKCEMTLEGHYASVFSAKWSPNGHYLATASRDTTAKLWDMRPGPHMGECLATYSGHTLGVWSVEWSPDGTMLATASEDATCVVWEAMSGEKLLRFTGHSEGVIAPVWNPSGTQIATVSRDSTVGVWDASTGEFICALGGHTEAVFGAVWNADGTWIATCSQDGTVRVWDAKNGDYLSTVRPGTGPVSDLKWSSDGKHLAGACSDGTAVVMGDLLAEMRRRLQSAVTAVQDAKKEAAQAISEAQRKASEAQRELVADSEATKAELLEKVREKERETEKQLFAASSTDRGLLSLSDPIQYRLEQDAIDQMERQEEREEFSKRLAEELRGTIKATDTTQVRSEVRRSKEDEAKAMDEVVAAETEVEEIRKSLGKLHEKLLEGKRYLESLARDEEEVAQDLYSALRKKDIAEVRAESCQTRLRLLAETVFQDKEVLMQMLLDIHSKEEALARAKAEADTREAARRIQQAREEAVSRASVHSAGPPDRTKRGLSRPTKRTIPMPPPAVPISLNHTIINAGQGSVSEASSMRPRPEDVSTAVGDDDRFQSHPTPTKGAESPTNRRYSTFVGNVERSSPVSPAAHRHRRPTDISPIKTPIRTQSEDDEEILRRRSLASPAMPAMHSDDDEDDFEEEEEEHDHRKEQKEEPHTEEEEEEGPDEEERQRILQQEKEFARLQHRVTPTVTPSPSNAKPISESKRMDSPAIANPTRSPKAGLDTPSPSSSAAPSSASSPTASSSGSSSSNSSTSTPKHATAPEKPPTRSPNKQVRPSRIVASAIDPNASAADLLHHDDPDVDIIDRDHPAGAPYLGDEEEEEEDDLSTVGSAED